MGIILLCDGAALAPAKRTYFLYADEGLIAETTQTITLNPDLSVTANASPVISAQYGPRPDSLFSTGTLFIKTGNSNGVDSFAYYQHDHLQTPIQANDKAGNVVWAANYAAFGLATITTPAATLNQPTIHSNLSFPGQYADAETGLHYNYFRDYDPATGRYVESDPIGLKGGINTYTYVEGNPVSFSDPFGLIKLPFYIPDSKVESYAREKANEFGYNVSRCTRKDLLDLIDLIPPGFAEDFKNSYESRPNAGSKLTPEMNEKNIREYAKEQAMIADILAKWAKSRGACCATKK